MNPTTSTHKCKCHGKPYTICPRCGSEHCPITWPTCPRIAWHPAHGTSDTDIATRYKRHTLAEKWAHEDEARHAFEGTTRYKDVD